MTFHTIQLGEGLATIEYVEKPATKHCNGCMANGEDSALCLALPDSCIKDGVIFVRRFYEVDGYV